MFSHRLQKLHQQRLNRIIRDRSSSQASRIFIEGIELINFASNDYLGLASHPEVVKAVQDSMEEFGFGSGASRLLGGGSILHRRLEDAAAQFKRTEAALVMNSGYAANTGILPAIAGEGDVLFSDELNHASIIDGCRLSRAETLVYRHRDVEHLSHLMEGKRGRRMIVATDTVFSMDGDIAPLKEIHRLCLAVNSSLPPEDSVLLYLDDAHGTGVLGNGKGALAHFGIEPEPWIIEMGTFSKALGSSGAFVTGSKNAIEWIVNTARSFIFSTAIPASAAAASAKAVEIVKNRPDLLRRLWENRDFLFGALKKRGYDMGESETPIIPLKMESVEDAMALSRHLEEGGIYAPAIRPPVVKMSRVRITVTAAHSEEDIRALLAALDAFPR
ncbi:MAG TPA: 8-amino-7-oxononanoate synthase [Thermodesulfovibrionales bacterium]|nr:8-amino-7-oxononanoate synthase [Thermodesulfovibrionales bacterium]